jgi:hypothetical protein
MKLIDAELVMMKGDNATEAERLGLAKFLRQQLRSYLTQGERVAIALSIPTARPGAEVHAMHQRAEVDLENTIHYISHLKEEFPALANAWDDCERAANALHQALRTSDNKARPPAAGS